MQSLGVYGDGVLQGFEQGDVLGDVVVLVSNPLGDADGFAVGTFNDDANAGRVRDFRAIRRRRRLPDRTFGS